jgi:hypothetical protein
MRALLGLFTVILTLFTFFGTAHADVIDPGNPYRKPNRPIKPVPVTRAYRMRDPGFTLTKVEDKKDVYLLRVTLPGPCEWEYSVYAEKEGTMQVVGRERFFVQDLKTESESRQILFQLPEEKETVKFLMGLEFTLYRFEETRYGPKVCGTDLRSEAVDHVYELQTVDGRQILKKL